MNARAIAAALALGALAAGPSSAAVFKDPKILFKDVTGDIRVTSSTATDEIEVSILQGKAYHRIALSEDKGVLTVTGEKWRDDEARDCCDGRIRRTVNLQRGRELAISEFSDGDFFADYPVITVTLPRKTDVAFKDARMKLKMDDISGALSLDGCYVHGETGDAGDAIIGVTGGSRLVVGDISAGLEINVSGAADVKTGSAASADIDIAGSGDVILGDIDGMLDVSIAGSGTARSTRLDGPLTVRIAGSGATMVKAGRADKLKATIDGSGGVFFDGTAVDPELRLHGSAEARLGAVEGRIMRPSPDGAVYVGGKLVPRDEDE
ncbi:MAG TPA: hypothetical protein VNH64_09405 [Parvularculaceae bacterium]|nr:hypothetical protein [Parvularculaceae bacterium]